MMEQIAEAGMRLESEDTLQRIRDALQQAGVRSFSVVDDNEVRVMPQRMDDVMDALRRKFPQDSIHYDPVESTVRIENLVQAARQWFETADIELEVEMELEPVKPKKIRELIQAALQCLGLGERQSCPKCKNKGWYIGPDEQGYPGTLHICERCNSIEYEDDAARDVQQRIQSSRMRYGVPGCDCGGRGFEIFDSSEYGFELQTCDQCIRDSDLADRILNSAARRLNAMPGNRPPRDRQENLPLGASARVIRRTQAGGSEGWKEGDPWINFESIVLETPATCKDCRRKIEPGETAQATHFDGPVYSKWTSYLCPECVEKEDALLERILQDSLQEVRNNKRTS